MEDCISKYEFELIQGLIEELCGNFISKDKSYIIENRAQNVMTKFGVKSYEQLYNRIKYDKDEELTQTLISEMTVHETFWFRDKTPWIYMEETLLPKFINEIRNGLRDKVRIWSCACSSGQEPYSISMCIDAYLKKHNIRDITLDKFEIVATDISEDILRNAMNGKYNSMEMERGLDSFYRNEYFIQEGNFWTIKDNIRNSVRFLRLNLKNNNINISENDVIFCRYVLIYFAENNKEKILEKIAASLTKNAVIFFGSSEIISEKLSGLTMVEYKECIHYVLES